MAHGEDGEEDEEDSMHVEVVIEVVIEVVVLSILGWAFAIIVVDVDVVVVLDFAKTLHILCDLCLCLYRNSE